ncbi:MAG TPA: SDR family oxidoreductase [Acidimicrobiales bacterium]|nr:SDR family oxidoreductase [Acidimicrobiales bacterium]
MTDPRRFDGRVAVVTGAASGVGAATAALLAERGAAVVVADIDGAGAGEVAGRITSAGGRAVPITVDVADDAAVADMVSRTVADLGRIDVLHNNAAALGDDVLGRDTDVTGVPLDVWDRTLAVTLTGAMLGCRYAVPHMLAQGSGAIVNTTSTAGQRGDLSRVAYGSAKAGVIALTLYVATMYGKRGIRCNAVAPGLVLSPIARRNMSDENLAVTRAHQLVDHLGQPEDIAAVVAFLASDEARFVTGQVVNADGGVQAHTPAYADYYPQFAATGKGWP